MKIFCSCSSDTYITDKIIVDSRSENSNVGQAGTLDLFKIYDESPLGGAPDQNELSRILLKFDLKKVKKLISGSININSNNFSAKLKLFDITAGNACPSRFKVFVAPLSQSFDEGFGRDVGAFSDIAVSNFLTASYIDGNTNLWFLSGANKAGVLGQENIDFMDFAYLNDQQPVQKIFSEQFFESGIEDLDIDVTKIMSATLAGVLPDHGLRLSFSGSYENDHKTRFVKRFASRHVSNPHLRPRIEISYDDSRIDNHLNFVFDSTGSLYLENVVNSQAKNIVAPGKELKNASCMKLRLVSGRYSFVTDVSQVRAGSSVKGAPIPGLYSASFGISSFTEDQYDKNLKVKDKISRDKRMDFAAYWESNDGSHVFHTGSLTVVKSVPSLGAYQSNIAMHSVNLKSSYSRQESQRIRLFAEDKHYDPRRVKKSYNPITSVVFDRAHYRVVDVDSGKIVFSFDESENSTRISSDSLGPYFDFNFDILPPGRSYSFEFLLKQASGDKIIRDRNSRFTVV